MKRRIAIMAAILLIISSSFVTVPVMATEAAVETESVGDVYDALAEQDNAAVQTLTLTETADVIAELDRDADYVTADEAAEEDVVTEEDTTFQTKRLLVKTQRLDNDFGAEQVICYADDEYILCYATAEQASLALQCFDEEGVAEYAEPDSVGGISTVPTDMQPNSSTSHIRVPEYMNTLDISKLRSITVAVVDTGVDTAHEYLQGRIVSGGYDFIESDTDVTDDNGHGTHVSGIIVNATPSNVKILPIKAMNSAGSAADSTAILAIRYAADHGADIINMSFSYQDSLNAIQSAIDYAKSKNCLCVAAAGNDFIDVSTVAPAGCDGVLTVSAVDDSDTMCAFSNFGDVVDIAAPGSSVLSSVPNNKYQRMSGTSMATPYAAAAAALIASQKKSITPDALKEAVCAATVDCGPVGKDIFYGNGALSFAKILGYDIAPSKVGLLMNLPDDGIPYAKMLPDNYKSMKPEYHFLMPRVSNANATDKTVTVTVEDPSILEMDCFIIRPKKPGTTTVTFTTANGKSMSQQVTIIDSDLWLDYAASSYGGGSGTMTDPYLIETPEQMAKMALDYQYDRISTPLYFRQTKDIDLSAHQWFSIKARNPEHVSIAANYDGGGYEIRGLTAQESVMHLDNYQYGLFAFNTGHLENIHLVDTNIDAVHDVGGLCAHFYGSAAYCSVSGIVRSATANAGGLFGRINIGTGDPTHEVIHDCYTDAAVYGEWAGGIVADYATSCRLYRCVSEATVSSPDSKYTGGIAEIAAPSEVILARRVVPIGGSVIDNCLSSTNIFAFKKFYENDTYYADGSLLKATVKDCYALEDRITEDTDPENTQITVLDRLPDSQAAFEAVMGERAAEWDFDTVWEFVDGKLRLRRRAYQPQTGDFDYVNLDGVAILTGYRGKSKDVVIPSTVDGLPVRYIKHHFELYGTPVTSLTFPSSVERIAGCAFANAASLQKVTFSEGLKAIGYDAFYNTGLCYPVILPKSLQDYGPFAFACDKLEDVYFQTPATARISSTLGSDYSKTVFHYPADYTDAWKNERFSKYTTKPFAWNSVWGLYHNYGDAAVSLPYHKAVALQVQFVNPKAVNKGLHWSCDSIYFTVDQKGNITCNHFGSQATVTVTSDDGSAVTKIRVRTDPSLKAYDDWFTYGGKKYYILVSGDYAQGWKKINGKWYYFNADKIMQTGWQKLGAWYYFASDGAMRTGWQKVSGKWYYMNSSGAMRTGWQKVSGKWYYMNSSGAMQTGWQKLGGKWYYFNGSGAMQTGWQKLSGKWYYFESSGAMRTANLTQGGKTYRFNSSGACLNP